jgi:hypothetical protein
MNVQSPGPPWQELTSTVGGGYLSVYYSDDLSKLPVRFVTKPGDNKSDPNLETLTYGLFSTCSPSMRSGVVGRRFPYIFFTTLRPGGRVLSGFYRVRWYASANSPRRDDFYLLAEEAHFVADPPTLAKVDQVCRTHVNRRFRNMLLLQPAECAAMRALLLRSPNSIGLYLSEIDRLERFNYRLTGFRYPSWSRKEKFDWSTAVRHLQPSAGLSSGVVNTSATGRWVCEACGAVVKNKALLRQCPVCGALGTLLAE